MNRMTTTSAALALAFGATCSLAQAASSIAADLPSGNYAASTTVSQSGPQSAFNGGTWEASAGPLQWLRVDLGSSQPIGTVVFDTSFGSPASAGSALYGVFLTDVDNTDFVGSPYGSIMGTWPSGTELSISLDDLGLSARYVALVIPSSTHIPALSDVRVYAPVPEAGTAALLLLGLAWCRVIARRQIAARA